MLFSSTFAIKDTYNTYEVVKYKPTRCHGPDYMFLLQSVHNIMFEKGVITDHKEMCLVCLGAHMTLDMFYICKNMLWGAYAFTPWKDDSKAKTYTGSSTDWPEWVYWPSGTWDVKKPWPVGQAWPANVPWSDLVPFPEAEDITWPAGQAPCGQMQGLTQVTCRRKKRELNETSPPSEKYSWLPQAPKSPYSNIYTERHVRFFQNLDEIMSNKGKRHRYKREMATFQNLEVFQNFAEKNCDNDEFMDKLKGSKCLNSKRDVIQTCFNDGYLAKLTKYREQHYTDHIFYAGCCGLLELKKCVMDGYTAKCGKADATLAEEALEGYVIPFNKLDFCRIRKDYNAAGKEADTGTDKKDKKDQAKLCKEFKEKFLDVVTSNSEQIYPSDKLFAIFITLSLVILRIV